MQSILTKLLENTTEEDGTRIYFRYKSSFHNLAPKVNTNKHAIILDDFKPDAIYTLGSVTNKNIIFLVDGSPKGVWVSFQRSSCKTSSAIIIMPMTKKGLCTKCLDNGFKKLPFAIVLDQQIEG